MKRPAAFLDHPGSFRKLKVTEWERNLQERPGVPPAHPYREVQSQAAHRKRNVQPQGGCAAFHTKSFTWKAKVVNSWSLHMFRSLQQKREDKETPSLPFHCRSCLLVSPNPQPHFLTFQQELYVHYTSIVKTEIIPWEMSTGSTRTNDKSMNWLTIALGL